MNRKYEVMLLLNPNLDKDALAKLVSSIETKLGGNIVKKEDWGIKDLAYKIEKSRKAYYVLYYVETTSENIQSLKDMIAITKDIVRPMILRHEKKWPFEYKTAAELKFPAPRPKGSRPGYNRPTGDRPAPKADESKAPKQDTPKADNKNS